MNSIKRFKCFFGFFMVIVMVTVMAAACGSKKEGATEPDLAETEVEVSDAESEESVDEPKTESDEASETSESAQSQTEWETINRYDEELGIEVDYGDYVAYLDIPEEKMQELYDMIEQSVREGYLTKYNIAPEEFKWPENNGGNGDPDPWMYLQKIVEQKAFHLQDGRTDEPRKEPDKYNLDEQLTDLMNCTYDAIANWMQSNSNNDDVLIMCAAIWHKIVIPNVTFE